MSKSVEQSDVLGRLLSAMGKGDINHFGRYGLEMELREIKAFYSAHRKQPRSVASLNGLLETISREYRKAARAAQ